MSLLQKASIITTPTAYAEDYLYSIKPAIPFGQELITNGNFVTDSDWTKNNAAISGGQATITVTGGAFSGVAQTLSYTSGRKYRLVANIKGASGSSGKQVRFMDNSSDIGGLTTSNGVITLNESVQNVDIIWTANSNSNIIRNDRHTSSGDYSWVIYDISIKELTDADFDFDRNSTGTRVNEDYLIEDVPYNFVTYSEEIKSTNSWTIQSGVTVTNNDVLAPNGTLTADKLVGNGTVGVYKQVAVTGVVTRSVYLKSVTGTVSVVLKDPALTVTQKTLSVTEKWQRFQLSESNGHASQSGIWVDDIPASGIYMWGAQIVKGDQPKEYLKTTDRLDIPRIDYTNGEPSILLEPSRTNLVTYSNEFTNAAWNKTNATITANQAISPEGIQNADKYSGTTTGQNLSISISVSDDFAYFFYVKYINAPFIRLRIDSISTWFNIETIEVATNGFADASIEDVGNGWRKLTVINTSFTGSFSEAFIHPHSTDNTTLEQDGGEFFLYGAQIEAGSYATSLIHTSGSTVTRSADAANNAGNSDLINSTEGVLYIERKSIADDLTFKNISLSDGTTPNSIRIYTNNVSNSMVFLFFVSGVAQASYTHLFDDITEFHKVAFKYKANDFSVFVDGSKVHTDTSGSVFSADTLNSLQFDSGAGSEDFYGNCKMVAVFKEALTDLELEKLTGYNNHELYMNYYNRLSYLGLAEEYNVESDINNYIL